MSNFALNVNSSPQAIIQSLNYALATAATATSTSINGNVLQANVATGAVTTNGNVVSYLYPYMNVAYANSASGSGFTSNCRYATYYGVHNTSANIADTNPADYQWYQVAGGFGNTKYLYYDVVGGRTINFNVGTTSPGYYYRQVQDNVAINLDTVTSTQTIYTALVYQGNVTVPGTPTGGSYNFSTFTLTPPSGWSSNIPAAPTGGFVYSSQNTFASSQNFNNPPVTTWTTPQIATASNGVSGTSTFAFTVYTLANTQPATPQSNTGTWNFATNSGTPPNDPNRVNNSSTLSFSYNGSYPSSDFIARQDYSNGYNYYTIYPFSDSLGNTGATSYLNVSNGNAVVDIFMVGPGSNASHPTQQVLPPPPNTIPSEYIVYAYGGGGGQVVLSNSVTLGSGTYTLNWDTYANNYYTIDKSGVTYARAVGGLTLTGNSQVGIDTDYLGGLANGAGGNGTSINGQNGIADPWGVITWAGQQAANGVSYFGAGGGGTWMTVTTGYSYLTGANGVGGLGGGGNANVYTTISSGPSYDATTYGKVGSGSGGGGYISDTIGQGSGGLGGSGIIILRQSIPSTWTITEPAPTANAVVWASTAYMTTSNVGGIATATTWSTPVQASALRGVFSSAYVVTATDPTFYTTSQYTAAFSASRSNSTPPIGTGYTPINGDTATFTYTPTNTVVTKTYNSVINTWLSTNTQYISGNLFVSNSVSASSLITTNLYPLNIVSQNATLGNTSSPGYWLQASTGSASFAGSMNIGNNLTVGNNASIGTNLTISSNLTVGNNASIGANLTVANNAKIGANLSVGNNLTVGNNAVIGYNLYVQGLITGGSLAANVVNSTNIAPNAVTSSAIAPLAVGAAAIASSSLLERMFSANSVPASALTPGASTKILTVSSTYDDAASPPVAGDYYDVGDTIDATVNEGDVIYISATVYGQLSWSGGIVPDDTEYQINLKVVATNPDTSTTDSPIASSFVVVPTGGVGTNVMDFDATTVSYSFTAPSSGTMTFAMQYGFDQNYGTTTDPEYLNLNYNATESITYPAVMTAILAPFVG